MSNNQTSSLTESLSEVNEKINQLSLNKRLALIAIKWTLLFILGFIGLTILPFNAISSAIESLSLLEYLIVTSAVGMFVSDIFNTTILVFQHLLKEEIK